MCVIGNISSNFKLSVLWSRLRSLNKQTDGRTEEGGLKKRSELTEIDTSNSCDIAMLIYDGSGRWSVLDALQCSAASSALHGR